MICTKCKTEGELKVFNSFQYYYCKVCKEEVNLELSESSEEVVVKGIATKIEFIEVDDSIKIDFGTVTGSNLKLNPWWDRP